MQIFNIDTPALKAKYKGAGYAIAAVVNGQLVDFQYLRDVLPDFEGDSTEDGNGIDLARAAIDDARLGPVVRQLQSLGDIFLGMCSGYTFVVL